MEVEVCFDAQVRLKKEGAMDSQKQSLGDVTMRRSDRSLEIGKYINAVDIDCTFLALSEYRRVSLCGDDTVNTERMTMSEDTANQQRDGEIGRLFQRESESVITSDIRRSPKSHDPPTGTLSMKSSLDLDRGLVLFSKYKLQ